jgi:hypothetical protein
MASSKPIYNPDTPYALWVATVGSKLGSSATPPPGYKLSEFFLFLVYQSHSFRFGIIHVKFTIPSIPIPW